MSNENITNNNQEYSGLSDLNVTMFSDMICDMPEFPVNKSSCEAFYVRVLFLMRC